MLIAVKLGGSIITDKGRFRKPKLRSINALCGVISRLHRKGYTFIVVHGAGSYAHIPSKKYGLAEGIRGKKNGKLGFAEVHALCEELSLLVVNTLIRKGVPAVSFHPATFLKQKDRKPAKINDSMIREYLEKGFVPVTHGDVVLDDASITSIISGDRLMEHFGKKIAGRLVFVSDVDGVFGSSGSRRKLIKKVGKRNFREVLRSAGNSQHTDVTGGMAGKIKNLMRLKARTIIVNGSYPKRVENAITGKKDIYTEFVPGP